MKCRECTYVILLSFYYHFILLYGVKMLYSHFTLAFPQRSIIHPFVLSIFNSIADKYCFLSCVLAPCSKIPTKKGNYLRWWDLHKSIFYTFVRAEWLDIFQLRLVHAWNVYVIERASENPKHVWAFKNLNFRNQTREMRIIHLSIFGPT